MKAIPALLAALVAAGRLAGAAPLVEIKAHTELALGAVRLRADGAATISGRLRDRLTGDPVPGQVVTIAIGGRTVDAVTRADGSFEAAVAVEPGPQPLTVSFRGGPALDPAELATDTDPARAPVGLAVELAEAPGGQRVTVRATVDDHPAALPVRIAIAPPGDDRFTDLATTTSDAPVVVTRRAAGGAGPRRIRATFAGDAARQPAVAEATVELTSATVTSMALAEARVAYDARIVARGRVEDEDGDAVAGAAVALASGDRRLAQGVTDDDGAYRLAVEAARLSPGAYVIQVVAEPAVGYLRASRSAPRQVAIGAPQPVPVSYTLLAFAAATVAAGGFLLARGRPWRRLRGGAPPAAAAAPAAPAAEREVGAVAVARPGLLAALRRPDDHRLAGHVRDTVRGRPIEGARLTLEAVGAAGGAPRAPAGEASTDAEGAFALDDVAAGAWSLRIAAPGHVSHRFEATVPHRGELRALQIELVPVRERAFQLYRRVALPLLPEPRLWGVWSPRQVVDHVRRRRPTPALAALTDLVEEIYFSARVAGEARLAEVAAMVDAAAAELAPPPAAAGAAPARRQAG